MSGPITPPLTVTTASGTPSGRPITTIKVSDGDLTISGNVATIDTSGSAATPGGSDTQVQYNNAGAFGGSADFTFTGIGGSTPTFTITNSGANTATLTQRILKLDGGTGGLAQIRSSTGDTGLLLTAAEEGLSGPFMLLDINSDPSQLLLKNGEEDGTIVIETDSGTGDITVNANGDLNLWGDSNSVNIRHQSGGAVDVVSATDTPAVLQVKTVGDGVPSINLLDDTRAITLKCDVNQKLKLEGGVNTFIFDASSATGGITFPDTTELISAEGTAILATGITDGYVLTADGAGASGWEAASGGGVTWPLVADASTEGAPAYTFTGDTNTGIFSSAADTIDLSVAGDSRLQLSTTELLMGNGAEDFKLLLNGSANSFLNLQNRGNVQLNSSSGISLTPNASNSLVRSNANKLGLGTNNVNTEVTTQGTGDLTLSTNNGSNSGTIVISDGVDGDIDLIPDGTGSVRVNTSTSLLSAKAVIVSDLNATAMDISVKNSATTDVKTALQLINGTTTTAGVGSGVRLQFRNGDDNYAGYQAGEIYTQQIDTSNHDLFISAVGTGGVAIKSPRFQNSNPPSSASDTGTTGTIAYDADYIYVCTATDTWKRTAIATW